MLQFRYVLILAGMTAWFLAGQQQFAPYDDPRNGGGEAMLTCLHHPAIFGYIGAFSGLTNYRAEKAGTPALNKYRLIWLGCGTDDSLYSSNKAVADWMDKNGVHHTFRSIPGAHVWPVWHRFLAEVAPQLFNGAGSGEHSI